MEYRMKFSAVVSVPDAAVPYKAADGTIVGFTLEDGTVIRPVFCVEAEETVKGYTDYRDVSGAEALEHLGVSVEDFERSFTPED